MEEVKEEEMFFSQNKQQFLREYKKMKLQEAAVEEKSAKIRRNEELLNTLHTQGVIDANGGILAKGAKG